MSHDYHDDPARDFRQRYALPEQFVWDEADPAKIDHDGYARVVLSLIPPSPARVLDVGSGPGALSRLLVDAGYRVNGVDYSDRAIGFARILVPEAEFETGDVRALPLRPEWEGAFDAAIHVEVLEHVPADDHERVLDGIRRCLAPGGVLVLAVPSTRMPLNKWHYKHFERDEGKRLLERCGFAVDEVVPQHDLALGLMNAKLWRLLRNRYYDLRVVRRAFRSVFLSRFNVLRGDERAGRFIYRAHRVR